VLESKPGLVLETNGGALTQVLGQLLSNCMDHAFPDKRAGTVRVAASLTPDGSVDLLVEDDGIGVATDIRPRLFEPFTTTGRADGRTGLGLHMVYTLVAGPLGGTVSVTDRPEGGTLVLVRLPATPRTESDTASSPSMPRAGAAGMPAIIT
jgi:signal transduction histidine kinase